MKTPKYMSNEFQAKFDNLNVEHGKVCVELVQAQRDLKESIGVIIDLVVCLPEEYLGYFDVGGKLIDNKGNGALKRARSIVAKHRRAVSNYGFTANLT